MDIRSLLSRYHIHYRERGANVSRNNVVINCPLCAKTSNPDPSEHMAVSLLANEYYCYRNPKHRGRYLPRLFRALQIPEYEYQDLIFDSQTPIVSKVERDFSLIRHFLPAESNQEALDYLTSRMFSNPKAACQRFRLLVDLKGRWAGRLILPLTIGWTGRAMRDHLEPRYLTHSNEDGYFLCSNHSTTVILVEGPIDAMRIATVSSQFDVIAKCRSTVSPAIVNYIRTAKYLSVIDVPDNDVLFSQKYQETQDLRVHCTYANVRRYTLPPEVKDFGMLNEHETRQILLQI
jgi:hypothetical protein